MQDTKMISFLGMERCDIPIYLSHIMAQNKLRVLVIDNSLSHDLFSSLKKAEENTNYVESERVVYMKNIAYSEKAFEKFDLVIVYHGFNMDRELLEISHKIVVIMDYFKPTMQMFQDYIDIHWYNRNIPTEKTVVLFRDKLSGKISEKYLLTEMGLSNVGEEYSLYFDGDSLALYQNFTYNGKQEPKGLPGDLKNFLNILKNYFYNKKTKKSKPEEDKSK